MSKEMLINFVPGEECRIAIVENGKLEEYYQERASAESHVSNIYKGRVTNTEPSIQAAFIDFGLDRNGFLHTSDLHPKYFPGKDREEFEKVGKKTARRDRPPIQKCLKRGDEILVQVLKEGIGTKGPTLTSYLSIPGRFLVMMPDMQQLGVTRKVEDEEERRKAKAILKELKPPDDFGFIVRTAGIGQTKTDLKRDMSYLLRLWKNIETNRKKIKRTGELYAESDLVIRTIRDVFTNDIEKVIVDDLAAARRAEEFLRVASPRTKTRVLYYDDAVPMFHRKGVETQIELITAREVPLPSGGALVIDSTEALVAIDVNSGKSRGARDAESNALNTNLEAVDEICRQLRLRDLGGIVVNDLIDMRPSRNRKKVEQRMRDNLKKDRAKTRVGPISSFGLLEMTRQRMRASLKKSTHIECRQCRGLGHVLSAETVVLAVMRRLALVMQRRDVTRVELTISPDVAFQLLNRKRGELTHIEEAYGKAVLVRVGGGSIDYVNIAAFDKRNQEVSTDDQESLKNLTPPSDSTYRSTDDPDLPETISTVVSDYGDEEEEDEANSDSDTKSKDSQSSSDQNDKAEDSDGDSDEDRDSEDGGKKKKRRRRRRSRRNKSDDGDDNNQQSNNQSDQQDRQADSGNCDDSSSDRDDKDDANQSDDSDSNDDSSDSDGKPNKKRRRRRRGGRGRRKSGDDDNNENDSDSSDQSSSDDTNTHSSDRSGLSSDTQSNDSNSDNSADAPNDSSQGDGKDEDGSDKPKKKRRRRRRRKSNSSDADGSNDNHGASNNKSDDSGKSDNNDNRGSESQKPSGNDNKPDQFSDNQSSDQLNNQSNDKSDDEKKTNKPSMRRKVRKRNAPPPPGSQGYSNTVVPRRE